MNERIEGHESKSEISEKDFIKGLREELIKNGVDEQLFKMPAVNERFVEVAKQIDEDNGAFIKAGDKRWTETKDVQKIVASNEIFPINLDGTFDIKFTSSNSKMKLNLEIKKITEELREGDSYLSIRSFDRYGSMSNDSTFIAFATEISVDKNGYEHEVNIYDNYFPAPNLEFSMDFPAGSDINDRQIQRYNILKRMSFDNIKDSTNFALNLTRKDGLIIERNSTEKLHTYYDNGDWCLCDITLKRDSEPLNEHEMKKYRRDNYELPNTTDLTYLYAYNMKDFCNVLKYYEQYQLIKFTDIKSKEGAEVGSIIDEFDRNKNNLVNKYPHLESVCTENRKDFINQINANIQSLFESLEKTTDELNRAQAMLSKTLEFSETVKSKRVFSRKINKIFDKNNNSDDKKEQTK